MFTAIKILRRSRQYSGFTLAEVLVTLAVIGVVAALTIPSMINNHAKKQTVVKLKQVYQILQEATKRSQLDNGSLTGWDYSDPNFLDTYYGSYLKVVKKDSWQNIIGANEFKDLSGVDVSKWNKPAYVLVNGMIISYVNPISSWRVISIDINGIQKVNTVGKDIFAFSFFGDRLTSYSNYYHLTPGYVTREFYLYPGTSGQCSKDAAGGAIGSGSMCSGLIMLDGWEIKDDYPW